LKAIRDSYCNYVKASTESFKGNAGNENTSENESDKDWENPEATRKPVTAEQNVPMEEFAEFDDIEPEEDVDIDALLENQKEVEDIKAEENSQNADYAA
jgi:hypothetical protein